MALIHAKHGQLIDLQPLADAHTDSPSTSLIKTAQLQLLHVVLRAGQQLPEHSVAGEISIQCLAGRVQLRTPGITMPLAAGQLTVLHGGEPHAVLAERDACLLVTLVLRH
jgi:quercetin dioxygenase-like cupin family protein